MKLAIDEQAFDIAHTVLKTAAIDCWTDDVPSKRFTIIVSRRYADDKGWDQSLGLKVAVEHHRQELLVLAQTAAECGESGLLLS